MSINGNIEAEQYKQTLQSVFPTKFEPGSLADRLLDEGLAKGISKGLAKGNSVGRIQELQALLGDEVSSTQELEALDGETLEQQLVQLRQRLSSTLH